MQISLSRQYGFFFIALTLITKETMFIFEKHSVTLNKSILETTTYCKFIISSH